MEDPKKFQRCDILVSIMEDDTKGVIGICTENNAGGEEGMWVRSSQASILKIRWKGKMPSETVKGVWNQQYEH